MKNFALFLLLWPLTSLAQTQQSAPGDATPGEKEAVNVSEFKKEEESLLKRNQPFYFAYGKPTSKLQLSFKVPIVKDQPIFLAYTQQMFWNLEENSKPFQDSTYNPELAYRWETNYHALSSIDFVPWSHLSNGKKDLDSRSFNKRYIRFNFEKEHTNWILRGGLQIGYLYDYEETNINIRNYIGPWNLSLSAVQLFDSWVDKSEVGVMIMPAGKYGDSFSQGGYQFSWSFRLGGLDLMPAFYLQYYHGYAETLLNYDVRVNEFRAGFIL